MPKGPAKDFVLSLRLPTSLLFEIDQIADKERLSRSDYIRKALSDAVSVVEVLRKAQTFFVTPAMMQFSLQFMEDLDIEKYATLSLQNALSFLKQYLNHSLKSSIVQKYLSNKKTIISGLLTYITQSVLGPTAQKWFERIHFGWEGQSVTITGMHGLGMKFSKFISYYFLHFFNIFNYTENIAQIQLKEDRLKLVYQGDFKEFDISVLMN
jgi:hypothetical protein